jgi:hypothetical protein
VVSFKDVFTEGLAALSFRSGVYEKPDNATEEYTNSLKAEIFTYINSTITRVSKVMVGDLWYKDHESASDFVTLWDGEKWLEFVDDSDFGGTPVVDGNCVSLIKNGSYQKLQKACILSKDLSGKKMGEVFPGICKKGGSDNQTSNSDIVNCDSDKVIPTGSFGYDLGFQSLKTNIEFSIGNETGGFSDNLQNFVNNSYPQSPMALGNNSNVCFYIAKTDTVSGKIHWIENKKIDGLSCQEYSQIAAVFTNEAEVTNYTIEKIGDKNIMIADVPNIYKKLNPRGLQYGCKFAFAKVRNRESDASVRVHQGDYCDANTRSTIFFNGDTKNGMQFINLKLFNFLLLQRGLPAFPS